MNFTRIMALFLILLNISACQSLSKFGTTAQLQGMSDKALFTKGEKLLAAGKYERAAQVFEALDAQYPYGPYSEQNLLNLIYAYHKSKDNTTAAATAVRFTHLYPRSRHVDYAYYMKGVADYSHDRGVFAKYLPVSPAQLDPATAREAYQDFSNFIRRFPKSAYVADAKQRMVYLRNLFAEKELNVAKFYMKKRAYVAAANRASNVIKQYSQAPQTQQALVILIEANQKLGLKKEAEEARLVLKTNYPNARYLKKHSMG